MSDKTRNYLIGWLLVLFILLPRVGLLFNGLDSQRIWDTNTPATFRFLSAVQNGELMAFLGEGQKYPLLGSYTIVPMVGAYYLVGNALNRYVSPQDFMHAYALGETNLFFWIRLEMLLMNLFSLWLLYRTTVRFTHNSRRAGLYVLIVSAVNFYITLFSVAPRIHNFAFFGVILTLYASLMLLEHKSWARYLAAFGAAAFSASVSQSGFTAFFLPLAAHCYQSDVQKWKIRVNKKLVISAGAALFITMLLGYPRSWIWIFDPALQLFSMVLLGSNHIIPTVSVTKLPFIYLFSSEYITLWLGWAAFWYRWCAHKAEQLHIDPYDVVALVHLIGFFVIFGFSSVFSGRFMLAIMPSLFFLLSRLFLQLEKRKWVVYPLIAMVILHAYGIVQLTRIAAAGDTRAEAAAYILKTTAPNDRLLTTLDPVLLGIVPTPASIKNNQIPLIGATDELIERDNLVGSKSRDITLWRPAEKDMTVEELRDFQYVIISWSDLEALRVEARLRQGGFQLIQTFYASRDGKRHRSFVPWDFITPFPHEPTAIALGRYRVFGPTLSLYERR